MRAFLMLWLQDYPEGPGVLLELVQNADDAGATKAAFLLDMRQHGTSSLLGPGMAAWQGPALLAYNNAIFSPGLWQAATLLAQLLLGHNQNVLQQSLILVPLQLHTMD